jgi:serine/threonine-protein kinase
MVAAALPGGDPLAAALAAGETPSPEMVAAAGATAGMPPKHALLCLAACVLGTIAAVGLIIASIGLSKVPLEMSTEVLQHRARSIVSQLGYDAKPADSAVDFDYDMDFQRWAEQHDKPAPQWAKILSQQQGMLQFQYRQGPRALVSIDLHRNMTPGIVTFTDPPTTQSGMINLMLDPSGRLTYFQALPPEFDQTPAPTTPVDWSPLFAAAGLDVSKLQPATPEWTSLAASDTRAAWTGSWPDSGRPLRVEAATWKGKPVYFQLIGPWTRPSRLQNFQLTKGERASQIATLVLFLLIMIGALALARRQYKQGRGDRQGAFQLARAVFLVQMGSWLCFSHFVADSRVMDPLAVAVSTSLFLGASVWVLYMGLEPYVRRLWPQAIISWTRLLSGRIRDPLVGRDVMFGVILGVTWVLIIEARMMLGFTRLGSAPEMGSSDFLLGLRTTLGMALLRTTNGIQGTLIFFTILVGLRYLLRNRWAAAAGFVLIFTVLKSLGTDHLIVDVATGILVYGIAAFALVRFGLITLAVAVFAADFLSEAPITLDFSHWYAPATYLPPLIILALGLWGFSVAVGGQKLFAGDLPE